MNCTRRDSLKVGLGIAAILTAQKAPAYIRGLVAANNTALVGGFKNPYVNKGLISMWDGEWNTEWGIHNPDSPIWKDLVGNDNWTISEHGSWIENALQSDGVGYAASGASLSSYMTCEACFTLDDFNVTNRHILTTGKGGFKGAQYIYKDDRTKTRLSVGIYYCFEATMPGIVTISYTNTSLTKPNMGATYCNGEQVESFFDGNHMSAGSGTPTIFGRIGGDRNVAGKMFCIRLYSRELSDAEILHNHNVDQERFGL